MTTTTNPAGAPAAPRPPGAPSGRVTRLMAALAPHATAVRAAGGVLTLVGALLPWATFVLNSGPYPDKATLQYFIAPLGVTGFRLHLLVFGIAALALTFAPVPARGRILRGLAWGVIAIAVVNGLYITVEGGGLGAITVADGSVAFGSVVTLLAGVLVELGARAGGVEPRPVWTWRFGPWVERAMLVVVYVLLLFVVAATLTSGGTGGAANPYAGAVFLSFLAALGGAFAALHASGLMTWVATVAERHRVFSVVVLLVIALALPLTAAGNEYWMTVAANIGVYAATAIGLNIVVGLAGLLDLGYVAFLGIGAFTAANLSGAAAAKFDVHLPFALVMVISAVIAGMFGAVVGSPTLRVRGDYLAIVTLAFGEIFVRTAQNNIFGLTGGSNAIPGIPQVELFGTRFSDRIAVAGIQLPAGVLYYLLIVFLVAIVMLVFSHLKESRLGRAWIAIREDEDAAELMGVETFKFKLWAFAIGAAVGGLSGAVWAGQNNFVNSATFSLENSILVLAAVLLGGAGNIGGAILGGFLVIYVPEWLRSVGDIFGLPTTANLFGVSIDVSPTSLRFAFFGIALIIVMIFRPQGLWPNRRRAAELRDRAKEVMVGEQ